MNRFMIAASLAAALFTASIAFAQAGTAPTADAGGPAEILSQLHRINLFEVDMGKLAKSHGGTQGVKDYGAMLVTDHQAADKELTQLAKTNKWKLETKAKTDDGKADETKNKTVIGNLKKAKGADFDKEFLGAMVDGHDGAIAKVKAAQPTAGAASDWLTALVPKLQAHRDQAAKLQGDAK